MKKSDSLFILKLKIKNTFLACENKISHLQMGFNKKNHSKARQLHVTIMEMFVFSHSR